LGILVDDATVTIENIERFLEEGHDLREAIVEGASQISVPALVSTLCICIVFLPDVLTRWRGAVPLCSALAEAVVFAMLASYLLSRTLVPTLAMYLLRANEHSAAAAKGIFVRFHQRFGRVFERVRERYHSLLQGLVVRRLIFIPFIPGALPCRFHPCAVPWRRLFPSD
jgi:multidrug efflux pump subunit AcrB